MTKKFSAKSVALAAGASLAISLAASPVAMADTNPFSMNKLSAETPMQLASGKCGEGKCGGKGKSEGKCGEGKCGGKAKGEGKCGEGKCGGKGKSEGKCGGNKGSKGKCGEGKCGGN